MLVAKLMIQLKRDIFGCSNNHTCLAGWDMSPDKNSVDMGYVIVVSASSTIS